MTPLRPLNRNPRRSIWVCIITSDLVACFLIGCAFALLFWWGLPQ